MDDPPAGLVLCVGETMAQVVPVDGRSLATAAEFAVHVAGAESNVALGLAALGTPSGWVSRVGDDALGDRVLAAVAAGDVDTTLVQREPGGRTGVFFKDPSPTGSRVSYYRDGSPASRLGPDDVDRILAARPRSIHVTGVSLALSPSTLAMVRELLMEARAERVQTTFDINYRPQLWTHRETAATTLAATAELADTVLVGLDEACTLWNTETPADVRRLLGDPCTVVVKDGSRSASALTHNDRYDVSALPVDVVEPVGAGDAFAAGWIHARLAGANPVVALRLGHLVAGYALRSRDDQGELIRDSAGLLGRATAGRDWFALKEALDD
ncbi:2-dehydro-3-deoxygluconokinase [Kribbella aluminosa]|uniref:2-dehydro-3-deoxygluconokinase n=1 Tax=Kribbella aluminosa TaxID=416017 RepID=A0ABS4UXD5_9ACTN|nr:sugar kinase [Kribbella aluminosa]MBP2356184.1 2-dehydro-3-deoxygluconokinase [Kribbella aluminosa]